jgi:hypothetical protein
MSRVELNGQLAQSHVRSDLQGAHQNSCKGEFYASESKTTETQRAWSISAEAFHVVQFLVHAQVEQLLLPSR